METVNLLSFAVNVEDPTGGYDPLQVPADGEEDVDIDERADRGYVPDPAVYARKAVVPPEPEKTPREKMEHLFEGMIPYKRFFIGLIGYCAEKRTLEEIEAYKEENLAYNTTVFTSASFCQMLCDAAALEKVTEDEQPYVDVEVEPVEVENEDGTVSLVPGEPPAAFWKATEEGLQLVADDNPVEVLNGIVSKEEKLTPMYVRILEILDSSDGVNIENLKSLINPLPVMQENRKTVQTFMDQFQRNGAVVYKKGWRLTDVGRKLLAEYKAK